MTRQLIGWFLLLPLSVVLIVLALANRHLVVLNFNPLVPVDAADTGGFGVPLFIIIYAVLLIGVLMGGVATWFAQGHHRVEKRKFRRESERLRHDLDTARRSTGPVPDRSLDADDLMPN
jgi:uncharacterized integral membrane protein